MAYIKYKGAIYSDQVPNSRSEVDFVSIPEGSIRINIPGVRQHTDYSCGAACLQAIARHYGLKPFANERDFINMTEMDPEVGSHPDQLVLAAKRVGLQAKYKHDMTLEEVKDNLEHSRPVLLALQAHGDANTNYVHKWQDGHWVVAIGFDEAGFFFEDPSLEAIRGYLSNMDLIGRWHSTTRHGKKEQCIGVIVWLDSAPKKPFYSSFAQKIP